MAGESAGGPSSGQDLTGTERRTAELERENRELREKIAALEEEQQRRCCIFQNMPVMIDALDDEGTIVFWNRECERVTGYGADEIVGNPRAFELLYPETRSREAMFREFDRCGGDFRCWELPLICKDGRRRQVMWFNVSQEFPIAGWSTWAVGVDITERKKAEDELRGSKHYAEALLNTVPDAIAVVDMEGRIQQVNAELLRGAGLQREQVLGKRIADLGIVDTDTNRYFEREVFPALQAQGAVHNVEATVFRGDGSSFPALVSFSLLKDGSGRPIGIVSSGRDVTQIKEAQHNASEKEQMLRATFDAITESVFLVDREKVIRAANETAAKRLGCEVEDLIGQSPRKLSPDIISEGVRNARQAHFDEVLRTGKPLRLVDRRDGMVFDQTHYPVFDERGRVSHVVLVAIDITERLQAQREAREIERRYQDLVENVNDVIYATDLDGRFTSVNRACKSVLGAPREQVLGTPFCRWIPEPEQPALEAARDRTLQGETAVAEFMIRDPDGAPRYIEVSKAPLVVDGEIRGTQGVIRDITERRRAEQVLRQREQMLRGLFNAVTESVLLTDPRGRLLALNDTAARHIGQPAKDLLGAELGEIDPEGILGPILEERVRWVEQVARFGRALRVEGQQDGCVFDHNLYPVFGAGGQVRQVAIFSKDVTRQRQAERALRESEERYRSLVEGLGAMVATFEPEGKFTSVNQAVETILGFAPEEVVGKHFTDFLSDKSRAEVMSQAERIGQGQAVRGQAALVHRDGRLVDVEYGMSPALRDGRVVEVRGITWDMTQRKRLERLLRESEQRYRAVVENAGEVIAVVDENGVFQFMNNTAGRRLGGSPGDFIGKSMWDLFPSEIAERQVSYIREVITSGQGVNSVGMSMVQGEWRWYNTTIEPLCDSDGEVTAGLVIARDIHELKQAQEELENLRERMMRAEQLASLGTLSATLAHELTQPLTVIRLSIQNSLKDLEAGAGAARALEDLQDGLEEVSHATSIVERFRNFARRSSEKITGKIVLSRLVGRVVRLLGESARRSNVVLDVEGLEGLPSIDAREKDLEQLFFALLQNAIQAADAAGESHVRISGVRQGGHIELRLTDDCGGIRVEDRERIFEPFFTTKPAREGTGLGLCIVQRVVAQAGGDVRVESQWGRGTTFVVTLPIEST
ncbi:MAG: PAS domain S-box protein [Sedimentisphaerales bacterium]|nr:PAS domain S-box protein [Sedimentisphaerales bacterium]